MMKSLKMKQKLKNQKGITLIALIITIIVLLILAGISVAMIVGDNGIITRSRQAKKETMLAAATEKVNLAMAAAKLTIEEETIADASYNPITAYSNTTSSIYKAINDELKASDGWEVGAISEDGKIEIKYNNSEFIKLNDNQPKTYLITINGKNLSVTEPKRKLAIGEKVNYSVTINEVTLDNWQVFYVDGDYTYIILDDYMPNSAIPSELGFDTMEYAPYAVSSPASSDKEFVEILKNKENWKSLLAGTINGQSVNVVSSEDVYAIGSPTIDLWVKCYNTTHPTNKLVAYSVPYYDYDDPDNYMVTNIKFENSGEEFNSSFFYHEDLVCNPNHNREWVDDNMVYGYLLADLASFEVWADKGNVDRVLEADNESNNPLSIRPVICFPTDLVNQ